MRFLAALAAASIGVSIAGFACSDDPADPGAPDASADVVAQDGAIDEGGLPPGTKALAQGPTVRAIAVSATHVYWSEGDPSAAGAIRRVPISGGTAETLTATTAGPTGIAVDATHVYFGTEAKNLMRVPLGGGTAEEIVKPTGAIGANIFAVATDGTSV